MSNHHFKISYIIFEPIDPTGKSKDVNWQIFFKRKKTARILLLKMFAYFHVLWNQIDLCLNVPVRMLKEQIVIPFNSVLFKSLLLLTPVFVDTA